MVLETQVHSSDVKPSKMFAYQSFHKGLVNIIVIFFIIVLVKYVGIFYLQKNRQHFKNCLLIGFFRTQKNELPEEEQLKALQLQSAAYCLPATPQWPEIEQLIDKTKVAEKSMKIAVLLLSLKMLNSINMTQSAILWSHLADEIASILNSRRKGDIKTMRLLLNFIVQKSQLRI